MAVLLKGLVQHFMSISLYENAIFYAERLYYESSTAETLHLLALCYFRMGKVNQTYLLLRDASHRLSSTDNKYLYALACIALDKLYDAESILQVVDDNGLPKMTKDAMERVPGKAAGVYLLGKICKRQHKKDMAVDYFKLSLQMDPYQWGAVVELCELGASLDVKSLYPVTHSSSVEGKGPAPTTTAAAIDIDLKPEGKSRSLFHDQHNEENNPPCNDSLLPPPVGGGLDPVIDPDSILNISTALHQANLSYTKRLYSLKLGESLLESDSCTPPPHSGLSLGLSSHAYRLPFGTPSSISSPLVDQHQQQQASQAQQHQRHLDAQRSQLFQNYSDMMGMSQSKTHSMVKSFSNVQSNLLLSGMGHSGIAMSHNRTGAPDSAVSDSGGGGGEGVGIAGKNLFSSYFAHSLSSSGDRHSGFHNRTTISSVAGSLPDPGDPRATLFNTPGLTPIYGNGSISGINSKSYTLNSAIGKGSHLAMNEESDIEVDDINGSMHLEDSLHHHQHHNNQHLYGMEPPPAAAAHRGKGDTSRRVSFGPNAAQLMDQFSPERQRKVIDGESPYKLQRQGSGGTEQSDVDIAVQRHHVQAAAAAAGEEQEGEEEEEEGSMMHHNNISIDLTTPTAGAGLASSPFPVMSSPIFGNSNYSAIEPGLSHIMHTVTPAAAKKKSHIPRRMLNSSSPVPATPSGPPADTEEQQHHHHFDEAATPMVDNSSLQLSPARVTGRKAAASSSSAAAPIVSPTATGKNNRAVSPKAGAAGAAIGVAAAHTNRDRNAITSPERRTVNTRASEKVNNNNNNNIHAKAAPPLKAGGGVATSSAAEASAAAGTAPSAVSAQDRSQAHSLLAVFARAYHLLCRYKCDECVRLLQSQLPLKHFKSGFSQQCVGKAYYESNQYKLSILAYKEMLKVEPFRVQGLEILSTALWQLKKDKELSALAQQVSDIDRLAPETWCVVGNCFSLQKEPETAIKFFSRSIQIDPHFAYAHTLSGHEQVNNEDLDKAIQSFRLALFANERHYNAWYGLGSIYFRQERFDLSEYHFRRALDINGASSVLKCYLSMALHAQRDSYKSAEALSLLEQACESDPKNPQLHFQRAHILVDHENLEDALEALLVVKEHAPKEPPVHALLGKVYHRLGYVQDALRHLNIAIDLDPKEATTLKQIMEHIDEPIE